MNRAAFLKSIIVIPAGLKALAVSKPVVANDITSNDITSKDIIGWAKSLPGYTA